MGADLCLAIADAPKGAIERSHVTHILTDAVLTLDDDIESLIWDSIFGGEDVSRGELLAAAEQAYDEVTNAVRDVVYVVIHGHPVWISGGMTWGDTPTDNYDNVLLLDYLQPNWEA